MGPYAPEISSAEAINKTDVWIKETEERGAKVKNINR